MPTHNLLPIIALALFISYSAIAMATSGAAAGIASPMLFAAIALLVGHARITESA